MAKTNITFGGISRITDLLSAQSGDCTEMINARVKDGSVVPACPSQMVAEIVGDVSKAVWHPAAEKWICIFAEGNISILNEDYSPYGTEATAELNGCKVTDAGIVGNTVVLTTDIGMRYILWKNKAYKWLGGLPRLDNSNVTVKCEVENFSKAYNENVFSMNDKNDVNFISGPLMCPWMSADSGEQIYNVDPKKNTIYYNGLSTFDEKVSGYISEAVESIHNNHAYIDAAVFQIAVRLFDESLVVVSPMITLYCPDGYESGAFNGRVQRGAGNFWVYWNEGKELQIRAIGFKPTFGFSGVDLSDWENIITEICLFSSGSIPFFELSKKERVSDGATNYEYWRPCVQSYDTFGAQAFKTTYNDFIPYFCFPKGESLPGYESYWKDKKYLKAQYTNGMLSGFVASTEASHDWFAVHNDGVHSQYTPRNFAYNLMYTEEYRKKIEEVATLHLCEIYDIYGKRKWEVDNVGSTELALQKSLVVEGAITELAEGNMHVYNQRVHMWGAKEVFPTYLVDRFSFTTNCCLSINNDGDKPPYTYDLSAYVRINVDGNDIVKEYKDINVLSNSFIDGMLNYPDHRAKEITLIPKSRSNNGRKYTYHSYIYADTTSWYPYAFAEEVTDEYAKENNLIMVDRPYKSYVDGVGTYYMSRHVYTYKNTNGEEIEIYAPVMLDEALRIDLSLNYVKEGTIQMNDIDTRRYRAYRAGDKWVVLTVDYDNSIIDEEFVANNDLEFVANFEVDLSDESLGLESLGEQFYNYIYEYSDASGKVKTKTSHIKLSDEEAAANGYTLKREILRQASCAFGEYLYRDKEGNQVKLNRELTATELDNYEYTFVDVRFFYPCKTFALTPHPTLNAAYCRIKTEDIDIFGAAGDIYDKSRETVTMQSWDVILEDNLPTGSDENYTPVGNLLKVSNAGNPFYFAGKNEVAVGNEMIMGVTANTVTLSQGQFGEQPLYVFCEDGIYVLSVDTSGEIAYRACNPVAEDVADNKGSIATAGGGVIYADARGIKMRVGEDVEILSNNINGLVGEEIAHSKSLRELTSSVGLSDIAQHPTRFEEYIHGAVATFHIKEDEVIVSNPNYTYSYIYNIPAKAWSKIVGSWCGKVDRPARCIMFDKVKKYVEDDKGIMVLSWVSRIFEFAQGNSAEGRMLIITRPQALGSTGYKRVMQMALRGWIDAKSQKMGCYLLGSNDGLHFSLINGKEASALCRDITMDKFPSKAYRWVMLAVGGTSGEKTSISMAELDAIATNDNVL